MNRQRTNLKPMVKTSLIILLVVMILIQGCASLSTTWPQTPPAPAVTATRVPPAESKPEAPIPQPLEMRLWFSAAVPEALRSAAKIPAGVEIAASESEANLVVTVSPGDTASTWVYALVAPFPTLLDGVTLEQLQADWRGEANSILSGVPLRMAASTRAVFELLWGAPGSGAVEVVDDADALLEAAWADLLQPFFAIVPFEVIEPRWKVLRVDGKSPFDKNLDLQNYPLAVPFSVLGSPDALAALDRAESDLAFLPAGNRDENQMTVLVMTGVTALVRSTGAKMEVNGMTYPGRDIREWLRSADLTHISNEIAFTPNCPPANPYQDTLQFCSRPEYIELLEDVGTDIIDMTGNHMLDWNFDSLQYTFDMYRERGWGFFASGETLAEARKALLVEDHGNRLAFIGCNPVGPTHAWATETTAGIATCDYEWMHAEITRLRSEGYLPVVTFQYHEYYTPEARPWQVEDFEGMARAGAVVVSGSQAHVPQAFGFYGDQFIHYGLGNLFFDQMDIPVVGTRREFIDRHVFYQGRYLGVELLTAMLEDYARPRPMTAEERESLLNDVFTASDWSGAMRKDGE